MSTFQPEEWEAVKEAVFECQSLSPADQEKYLREHCPSPGVRREVERLLQATSQADAFLKQPAGEQLFGQFPAQPSRIGPFQVQREIGRGGMGIVFEAMDERLGRQVALKVLHPVEAALHEGEEGDVRRRLLWEARAASSLNHPNIVTIYEVGSAGGVDYVAMERLSGRSLGEILQEGKLPCETALRYAVQMAGALETAHAGGIVHRDLKPGNIMVTNGGVVKLVDFGLAKSLAGPLTSRTNPRTIQGGFAGTVAYVSPEQATGQAADTRSDVFAFGCVFYEMLTGRKAFRGETAVSVLAGIIHIEPDPLGAALPRLDPRIDEIVRRCLRKDRERRYQSMGDVRVLLEEILDGIPPVGATRRRRRVVLARVGGAGVLAAGVLLWLNWYPPRAAVGKTPTLSKIGSDVGFNGYPAISGDGKLLAYASDRGGNGNLDLWLQQVGGGDPVRITNDPADDLQPGFSPDGTRIVFRSERRGGGVYIASTFSGGEQLLVPRARDPKFSPDGTLIACWTGAVGGAFYPGSARIVLVSTSTRQTRAFRPDFEAAAFPVWISDSRLLFLGRRKGPGGGATVDWWIADIQGKETIATGALRRFQEAGMLPAPAEFWIQPEAWLGRSQSVVFTATHGDATNVWQLPIRAGAYQAGAPGRMTVGPSLDAWPGIAENGTQTTTVFASLSVDIGIHKLALTAGGGATGVGERVVSGYSDISSPSISHDGRTLVFAARQPGASRIVAVDLPTAGQHVIATLKQGGVVHPVLSGNGKLVAYVDGRTGYLASAGEGTATEVCPFCGAPTDVDEEGTGILFESAGADEKLLLWTKGGIRPLIAGPDPLNRMQFGGHFSPDGKRVVFCAGARGSPERRIVVVPNAPDRALRPEEWTTISDASDRDRAPNWAPDGRHVYYLSEQDGSRCIWARPVDSSGKPTGPAFAVAHYHTARRSIRGLKPGAGDVGLSVARGFLIFTLAEVTGSIWFQQTPADR